MAQQENRVIKYPNAFTFGFVTGGVFQMAVRALTHEPLSARPFSYLRFGFFFGITISYYDYWRRNALEDVLHIEAKQRYYT